MFSSTHIHFIRNSATDSDTDDCATIQRNGVDQYELTYTTTATETSARNTYTVRTDDKGIFRWMRSVIALVEADADPFKWVQFDFPAAPSVMIATSELHTHYHAILDALEVWLDDGETSVVAGGPPKTPPRPTRPVEPNAPVRRSHHMFFDLGDDYE
jgi:hypothetical protein